MMDWSVNEGDEASRGVGIVDAVCGYVVCTYEDFCNYGLCQTWTWVL